MQPSGLSSGIAPTIGTLYQSSFSFSFFISFLTIFGSRSSSALSFCHAVTILLILLSINRLFFCWAVLFSILILCQDMTFLVSPCSSKTTSLLCTVLLLSPISPKVLDSSWRARQSCCVVAHWLDSLPWEYLVALPTSHSQCWSLPTIIWGTVSGVAWPQPEVDTALLFSSPKGLLGSYRSCSCFSGFDLSSTEVVSSSGERESLLVCLLIYCLLELWTIVYIMAIRLNLLIENPTKYIGIVQ